MSDELITLVEQLNRGEIPLTDNLQESQTTSSSSSFEEVKDATISAPVTPIPDFDGIDFKDPFEMLCMVDDAVQKGSKNGGVDLHQWQVQFMIDFSRPEHTKDSPFQAEVQSCNGSGKDKYVIAACSVWLCMKYREAQCPITSSSGDQLDKQTGAHIDRLCRLVNSKFGPIWKIQYRYYECQHTDEQGTPLPSVITMFATDEAGKAEGYHPADAGKKMAIFTSETKSIPSDITDALERCTGYTHRVDASSPGLPAGYFYDTCSVAIPRSAIEDIKELDSTQFILYKITVDDCPHISESEKKRVISKFPGGVNNSVVRSSLFAEFGSTDEMIVIPSSFVWNSVNSTEQWIREEYNTGGLDLSDGGAENVLISRNGNKMLKMDAFRFENTEDTIDYLEQKFEEHGLKNYNAKIYADSCGIGKPMLNALKRRGWKNIVFVDSRNTASEKRVYANRGTELFFNVRELMAKKELIILRDKMLIAQLSTRYYKITKNNIHQLLSKLEQRAHGYRSPDRADALNLCFWRYKSTKIDEQTDEPFRVPVYEEVKKTEGTFDLTSWANRGTKKFQPENVKGGDLDFLLEEITDYNQQLAGRN